MGSPWDSCDLWIDGDWSPDLPVQDWQGLSAESPDGRYLALVRWDTTGNEPGFRIYTLDDVLHTVAVSPREHGCCVKVWWHEGAFRWSLR